MDGSASNPLENNIESDGSAMSRRPLIESTLDLLCLRYTDILSETQNKNELGFGQVCSETRAVLSARSCMKIAQ